jgi:S-DNA-T family DNA segregation ATPase FtsK/SpoIIIE
MSDVAIMEAPAVAPAASSPAAAGVELVGRVAAERVKRAMQDSPDRKVLFMISRLDADLACAVARQIKLEIPTARVEVHEKLADDTIPADMVSSQSIGDYRNMGREGGSGAIVFAPSSTELDAVGQTAADIQNLSQKVLLSLPELWLQCSSNLEGLDGRPRQHVLNILRGIVAAQELTTGLKMFGEFVWRLDHAFASYPLERALDEALPALRIPRKAARFKKCPDRGKLVSSESWAEKFRGLHAASNDALYLRKDGSPLGRPALRQRLAELERDGTLDDAHAKALSDLIADERILLGRWSPTQAAAAELPWEIIERLVKTSKRKAQKPLGEATLESFERSLPNALDAEDRDVLGSMGAEAGSADDDERAFFFKHRANIAEAGVALLKRWEQHVFTKTDHHPDLALGLFMAVVDLVQGTDPLPRVPAVVVKLQGADRKSFWDAHNAELCRFVRDRYRGLPMIFAAAGVYLDFGMCWSGSWDAGSNGNARTARAAREFKFDIFLVDAAPEGCPEPGCGDGVIGGKPSRRKLDDLSRSPRGSAQFVWTLPADSMASSYSENLLEIADLSASTALLGSGRFARSQTTDRSDGGRLSLLRRDTFQDANGRPHGIMIDPNNASSRVGDLFEGGLAKLRGDVLPEQDAQAVSEAYAAFVQSYTQAVRGMVLPEGEGLLGAALFEQAAAYGTLLDLLRSSARKDDCRRELWAPILSLGIAFSDDRPTVGICTPWHPFKLAAAASKAHQLATALRRVLENSVGDFGTFADTVSQTVSEGWHPAIALFTGDARPQLLVETDQFADFGLMEAPTADQGAEDAFDGHSDLAAKELLGVVDEYLEIQPHERANFSIVLYNSDNRSLPSQLATSLAQKIEREQDLRCDLILTHSERRRLRQIYTEQNVAISARLDGALANEAAQTFLSRLRVGFLDLGGLGKTDESVQAADIVFLHDVIARGARSAWRRISEPSAGWPSYAIHAPDGETRRRHFEKGTRKTETMLVPASRPQEVQRYLNLVRDHHQDFRDEPEGHYVPVREIDFDESGVATIIEQAHRVARWVVTYDAIADLQLFKNNKVNIIRFLTKPGSDHNLVVSTRHAGSMLLAKLSDEIGKVLGAPNAEAEALARVCVAEASAISGRVVLRAARLENNALELLGLVLSKRVILDNLPETSTPVCWLLLDDFADWLGHKGRKADILIVCLSAVDDVPTVDLVVVESKFGGLDGECAAMAESLEQMRASTNDLRDRLVYKKDVLNRPTWLRRLADLLLEHGAFPGVVAGHEPQEWARLIRSDEAVLRIMGLSLVFVHDRYDGTAEPLPTQTGEQCQFTFNREQVAEGLRQIQAKAAGDS